MISSGSDEDSSGVSRRRAGQLPTVSANALFQLLFRCNEGAICSTSPGYSKGISCRRCESWPMPQGAWWWAYARV